MGIRLHFPFLDNVLFTCMLPLKYLHHLVFLFCTTPFGISFKVFTPYILHKIVLISDLNLFITYIHLREFVQILSFNLNSFSPSCIFSSKFIYREFIKSSLNFILAKQNKSGSLVHTRMY